MYVLYTHGNAVSHLADMNQRIYCSAIKPYLDWVHSTYEMISRLRSTCYASDISTASVYISVRFASLASNWPATAQRQNE